LGLVSRLGQLALRREPSLDRLKLVVQLVQQLVQQQEDSLDYSRESHSLPAQELVGQEQQQQLAEQEQKSFVQILEVVGSHL
jgi:uncharacterized membrane protein YccC